MACLSENIVGALLEETLSDVETEQVSAHLARCPDCRELVSLLQTTGGTAAAPVDPLVGQVLADTYRVLFPIGSGGMGAVYAAEHVRLGRRVSVKLLRAELRQHPEVVERFRREAQICGTLGSRHIVDILDFNQLPDGMPYMVMELLRGEDLAQRLALGGRLPHTMVVEILRQVCAALIATHEEGILHRDLKPSNIYLCEEEDGSGVQVKVLDFGISKARRSLATLTGTNEILGTPAYMSPEMASAKGHQLDARSDLFALGAIAYEALTGRQAFEAESIPAVLYRIVHEDPRPPRELVPEIPEPLSRLVMALLSKEQDRRPESARQVAELLGAIQPPLTGAGVAASLRPGAVIPPTLLRERPAGRRRALIGLGLVLAAALTGAAIWWWDRSRPVPVTSRLEIRPEVKEKRAALAPARSRRSDGAAGGAGASGWQEPGSRAADASPVPGAAAPPAKIHRHHRPAKRPGKRPGTPRIDEDPLL